MKQRYKIIITFTIIFALCLVLSSCQGQIDNISGRNNTGPVLCIHEYEESTVREATCTEDGELLYKCRKCGDSYNEPIPAKGHDMQLIEATESVCVEESKRVYKCSRCDYTVTETQPRKDRNRAHLHKIRHHQIYLHKMRGQLHRIIKQAGARMGSEISHIPGLQKMRTGMQLSGRTRF